MDRCRLFSTPYEQEQTTKNAKELKSLLVESVVEVQLDDATFFVLDDVCAFVVLIDVNNECVQILVIPTTLFYR